MSYPPATWRSVPFSSQSMLMNAEHTSSGGTAELPNGRRRVFRGRGRTVKQPVRGSSCRRVNPVGPRSTRPYTGPDAEGILTRR